MEHENLNTEETANSDLGAVMCSQSDDDAMIDWYMSQQPILTAEETIREIEKLNKCADYILKTGITPNLDSIY